MILTRAEARTIRMAIMTIDLLEEKFFSITVGEHRSAVTVEFDSGIITVKNHNTTELYQDLKGFVEKYGL